MLRQLSTCVACVVGLSLLALCHPTVHGAADTGLALGQPDWPPPVLEPLAGACASALSGSGKTYNVGPGQTYEELTQIPWLSLRAGDVVNIFHRAEPYRTKIGLRAQGTPTAPVVINGVTDAQCNRPEISGQNAVTAADAVREKFYNKQHSENLGLLFIYQASNDKWGYRPAHITIQNLKLTGAHKSNTYAAQDGTTAAYNLGAAGIYAVRVEGLRVENNEITGNGNGVFVNSRADDDFSEHIVVRRNRIHANGNVGSYTEHNLYIQARRPLYEGNYIGQLIPGARGSSLKDRSSATVIRYNHIDAATRAIDLVEIEGGVAPVRNDPLYHQAWVYGNLIVSDHDAPARSSTLLIHWGGDNDPRYFRSGPLHFFNNTVVTRASKAQAYYLCVFDMPGDSQSVHASANVFAHHGSSIFALGYKGGKIVLRDANWLTSGWVKGWGPGVVFEREGTALLEGQDPRLDANYAPLASSPLGDKGTRFALGALNSTGGIAPLLMHQYAMTAAIKVRPPKGAALGIGAFEMN